MGQEKEIPEYLQDTYNMLRCAFPGGVNEGDYIPLLAILHEYMSFRTLATVLSAVTDKDYGRIYNDVGFQMGDPLYRFAQSDLERVREKLMPCGFEQWLESARIEYTGVIAQDVPYDDYLTGRFGKHTEWLDGKVIALPDPTLKELRLRWFLRSFFDIYLNIIGGGASLSDPFTMKLGANLPTRQPDNYVILPDRLHFLKDQGCMGAANLVVEIVTPGCENVDLTVKFAEYEKGGVQEYWILDYTREEALFYVRGEDGLFHSRLPENSIYTSYVLPKLKLPVALLWQDKLPTTPEIIKMVEQMLEETKG